MEKIDSLDKKILSILSKNARIPFKDVAAECGVSRAAIHQRVQHLIEGGVITGSGFDVNPKSLGYTTCIADLFAIVTAAPLYLTLIMVPFKFVDFPALMTGTFAADTGLLKINSPHSIKNVSSVFLCFNCKLLS